MSMLRLMPLGGERTPKAGVFSRSSARVCDDDSSTRLVPVEAREFARVGREPLIRSVFGGPYGIVRETIRRRRPPHDSELNSATPNHIVFELLQRLPK